MLFNIVYTKTEERYLGIVL